jgi:general secretion pathway protein N
MIRWGVVGALLGALLALLLFAPASWLASRVTEATGQRLLLADARGTIWQGSAVVVLTGGPGSRDASALPGRLAWTLGREGTALVLTLSHACCLNGERRLLLRPGFSRFSLEVPAVPGAIGQWPAGWLVGLGTPWNTLQPSGSMQLSSNGLTLDQIDGHWLISGSVTLELSAMASRVSTLDTLGSYRLTVVGGGPAAGAPGSSVGRSANVQLGTIIGPLQLSGSGQWIGSQLRFSGTASADAGSEAVLSNLLNLIGRRQGAQSVISIG